MTPRIRNRIPMRLRYRRRGAGLLGGLLGWLSALAFLAAVGLLAWHGLGPGAGRSAFADDPQTFVAHLEALKARLTEELKALDARAETLTEEARTKLAGQRERLVSLQAEAQRLLDEARSRGESAWQEARPRLEAGWERLREEVRKIRE